MFTNQYPFKFIYRNDFRWLEERQQKEKKKQLKKSWEKQIYLTEVNCFYFFFFGWGVNLIMFNLAWTI